MDKKRVSLGMLTKLTKINRFLYRAMFGTICGWCHICYINMCQRLFSSNSKEKKKTDTNILSLMTTKQNKWDVDYTDHRYISSHLLKQAILKIPAISKKIKTLKKLNCQPRKTMCYFHLMLYK